MLTDEAIHYFVAARFLDRFLAALAGADSNAVFKREDEDFAVADLPSLPCATSFDDCVNRRLHKLLIHSDLKLYLAEQIHGDFVPAEYLGVPFLTTKALHIHNRQAKHLDFAERGLNRFEASRLNDGDNQLHGRESS